MFSSAIANKAVFKVSLKLNIFLKFKAFTCSKTGLTTLAYQSYWKKWNSISLLVRNNLDHTWKNSQNSLNLTRFYFA